MADSGSSSGGGDDSGSGRGSSTPINEMMSDKRQAAAKDKLLGYLDQWVASGQISSSRREELSKLVDTQVAAHNNDQDDLAWFEMLSFKDEAGQPKSGPPATDLLEEVEDEYGWCDACLPPATPPLRWPQHSYRASSSCAVLQVHTLRPTRWHDSRSSHCAGVAPRSAAAGRTAASGPASKMVRSKTRLWAPC